MSELLDNLLQELDETLEGGKLPSRSELFRMAKPFDAKVPEVHQFNARFDNLRQDVQQMIVFGIELSSAMQKWAREHSRVPTESDDIERVKQMRELARSMARRGQDAAMRAFTGLVDLNNDIVKTRPILQEQAAKFKEQSLELERQMEDAQNRSASRVLKDPSLILDDREAGSMKEHLRQILAQREHCQVCLDTVVGGYYDDAFAAWSELARVLGHGLNRVVLKLGDLKLDMGVDVRDYDEFPTADWKGLEERLAQMHGALNSNPTLKVSLA